MQNSYTSQIDSHMKKNRSSFRRNVWCLLVNVFLCVFVLVFTCFLFGNLTKIHLDSGFCVWLAKTVRFNFQENPKLINSQAFSINENEYIHIGKAWKRHFLSFYQWILCFALYWALDFEFYRNFWNLNLNAHIYKSCSWCTRYLLISYIVYEFSNTSFDFRWTNHVFLHLCGFFQRVCTIRLCIFVNIQLVKC